MSMCLCLCWNWTSLVYCVLIWLFIYKKKTNNKKNKTRDVVVKCINKHEHRDAVHKGNSSWQCMHLAINKPTHWSAVAFSLEILQLIRQ